MRASPLPLAGLALCLLGFSPGTRADEDPAAAAFLAGDYPAAQRLLETEIQSGQARGSRSLLLGRVYFLQEMWAKAAESLAAHVARDPDDPQARELLGRALFRLGRLQEALPLCREAVRETGRPELRLELAEVLVGLGFPAEAVPQLKQVLLDVRPWPRAHYLLGSLRLESGLGHWASRDLWAALRLGSPEPDLRWKLAQAFQSEARITGALLRVGPIPDGKAGDRTEDHVLVRSAGAGVWYAASADTALYQVETVLAAIPDPPEAVRLLAAQCWLSAGEPDAAAAALAGVRTHTVARFALLVEIALARRDLAGLRVLLTPDPAGPPQDPELRARQLLAAALLAEESSDAPAALEFLQESDRILPGRSETLRSLVEVLARLDRKEEAAAAARRLALLHPDSPEVHLLARRRGVDLEAIERDQAPLWKDDDPQDPAQDPDAGPVAK